MNTPELSIDGAIATLTLRRPEQANRLGPDDLAVLAGHIATVNAAPDVLVLRVQATGKYFCSGYDIGRIGAARTVDFEVMVNQFEDARPVTLAVLQGGVYGGATDLALACDLRLGVTGSRLFMPAARFGLHYYAGGLRRYVTRLGLSAAKKLFLTAMTIECEEMLRIGFLNEAVAPERLAERVDEHLAAVLQTEPVAVREMKKHLHQIADGHYDEPALRAATRASLDSPQLRERLTRQLAGRQKR